MVDVLILMDFYGCDSYLLLEFRHLRMDFHPRKGGRGAFCECGSLLRLWSEDVVWLLRCASRFDPLRKLPSGYVKIAIENGHRYAQVSHNHVSFPEGTILLLKCFVIHVYIYIYIYIYISLISPVI